MYHFVLQVATLMRAVLQEEFQEKTLTAIIALLSANVAVLLFHVVGTAL